ncbi:MAG: excinuclease ABC subunit UvrC [Chloroflexi bacterium]|nr:excinuclease ABC subunit UvrC [Chloroflexota bacterium]
MTTTASPREQLVERLASVPVRCGVYLMRDAGKNLLYVGKASSLRDRMRSYFGTPAGLAPKIRELVARIADYEYIVTESEQEALLLENNLIKQHQPYYNSRLRDDKTYPYIKIDLKEEFPQVYITRRAANDGAKYFGPFASAGSVRKTLDLIKRLFPYRSCTKAITGTDDRPCLDFHIRRCVGPCIGAVDRAGYMNVIDEVVMFLEGRTRDVVAGLKQQMNEASESLQFERAAALRDRLRAIERVYEGQKVVSLKNENMDVVAVAYGRNEAWVEIFFIRQGSLIGRDNFIMDGTQDEPEAAILSQFIKQFYDSASYVPPRILVPVEVDDHEVIAEWLTRRRGSGVQLLVPERGEKRRLLEMVKENARHGLENLKAKWAANDDLMQQAMQELGEALNLPRLPRRMECYDISHIQGTSTVASMVVFEDGKPKKAHYRRFKIKTVEGNDDFASMREVLSRRFRRLRQDEAARESHPGAEGSNGAEGGKAADADDGFKWVPDLVLIDGGKGQLGAAVQVFLELGVKDVPLASLAKQQEEIFVPQTPEPILLPRSAPALFLVQRIRDEAHRFAVTFHRDVRKKASIKSALDLVPGVGPKRKRQLLRQFGSVKAIREATVEELASAPGMTRKLADTVKQYV